MINKHKVVVFIKPANLIGQVFDDLTVEEKKGTKKINKTTSRVLWKCKCICGQYTEATTNELTQHKKKSCGCRKQKNAIPKRKTQIGDIYGYLLVEELVGKNNDNRLLYKCKCLRCGGSCITTGKNLRSGCTSSCGCIKRDLMSHFGNTNFKDLTGQIIGYLLVESRAPTKYSSAGNQTTMWNCKCLLCGNKTVVAYNALSVENHTRSCGCLRMSYAEYGIQNELKRLNIDFIFDYSFKDLISPNSTMPLRFDFALFDNDKQLLALIEHQGPQHYQKYKDGFGDFQREVTDQIKRDYCKNHNIPLYEIRYDEETIIALHKILSKVYHTSYDNTVPSLQETV